MTASRRGLCGREWRICFWLVRARFFPRAPRRPPRPGIAGREVACFRLACADARLLFHLVCCTLRCLSFRFFCRCWWFFTFSVQYKHLFRPMGTASFKFTKQNQPTTKISVPQCACNIVRRGVNAIGLLSQASTVIWSLLTCQTAKMTDLFAQGNGSTQIPRILPCVCWKVFPGGFAAFTL